MRRDKLLDSTTIDRVNPQEWAFGNAGGSLLNSKSIIGEKGGGGGGEMLGAAYGLGAQG